MPPTPQTSPSYFSGRVHSVNFDDKTKSFYILRVSLDAECITAEVTDARGIASVTGNIPGVKIAVGVWFGFEGVWHQHPKYGKQIKVTRAPVLKNGWDDDTCVKVLVSQGVGSALAAKIRAHFKTGLLEVLSDPKKLCEVPGITVFVGEHIAHQWKVARGQFVTLGFLGDIGLTQEMVRQVWSTFGDRAQDVLSTDPWSLSDIDGVTFQDCDTVAHRLNLDCSPSNLNRVRGAIVYAAKSSKGSGHLYLTSGELLGAVRPLDPLMVDTDIAAGLKSLVDEKRVVVDRSQPGVMAIYDPWSYETEDGSARILLDRLVTAAIPPDRAAQYAKAILGVDEPGVTLREAGERHLASVGSSLGVSLSPSQAEAVLNCLTESVSVITGLPGSGKTTSLRMALGLLHEAGMVPLVVAPTGIAAKRVASVTGVKSSTIHRAFKATGIESESGRESTYAGVVGDRGDTSVSDGSEEAWGYGPGNPHPAEVVVVDECFHYKQPVLTENGWEYIGKIVEQQLPVRVWSRNPSTGVLELKTIVRYLKRPSPKGLLRVSVGQSRSMRSAKIIRCTPDHKIMTPSGYVRAGDLKVGDPVVVRGVSLTRSQMSVLVGSILGDGSLNRNTFRNSPQVSFCQGEAQTEYLSFKHSVFGTMSSKVSSGGSGYGTKSVYRFTVKVCDEAWQLQSGMLADGCHASGKPRWAPSREFLNLVDEQALATWFLDNGSVVHRATNSGVSEYATLHTQRFSVEAHGAIQTWFSDKFRLHPVVGHDPKRNLYWLRFSKSETEKLFNIIRPFVPACMSWKVAGGAYKHVPETQSDTTVAPVSSVTKYEPKRTYPSVYDLEVQDHHNYVAGNVVVSNCSMVDQAVLYRVLTCTRPDCRLVFVGDSAQLPSVGAGNVLRDIIASGRFPTVSLTEIFRQADTSPIVTAAHDTFHGIVPAAPLMSDFSLIPYSNDDDVLKTVLGLSERLYNDRKNFQVLSPRHAGTLGVTNLNNRLRALLNPAQHGLHEVSLGGDVLREGDRVIVSKNDYKLGVFNGDVAKVNFIDKNAKEIELKIHGPPVLMVRIPIAKARNLLRLAYAVTVHRCQGLEYDVVVMPLVEGFAHQLQRNLFYTAITRAKKKVLLVGSHRAMERAVNNNREDARNTMFAARLQGDAR